MFFIPDDTNENSPTRLPTPTTHLPSIPNILCKGATRLVTVALSVALPDAIFNILSAIPFNLSLISANFVGIDVNTAVNFVPNDAVAVLVPVNAAFINDNSFLSLLCIIKLPNVLNTVNTPITF